MTRRALLLPSVVLLAAMLLPGAAAQSPFAPVPAVMPPGAIVGPLDIDVSPSLIAAGLAPSVCALDDDGDGAYDAGEAVVVDLDAAGACGATEGNDLRLLPSAGHPAGTTIRTSDQDFGVPLLATPLADGLMFFDANGDGSFGLGDTLYLDIVNAPGARVDVGDLRLSPAGSLDAGTAVASGDADLNRALVALPGPLALSTPLVLTYYDVDADGAFSRGDLLYLDPDGPAVIPLLGADVPVTGDVRLMPAGPYPFGSIVGPIDLDTVATYRVPVVPGFITGNLCAVDDDSDGAYDAGEPLYFDVDAACATGVEATDLRLLSAAGQPAGSMVRSSHGDYNSPVIPAPAENLRFFDANGDAMFNAGDALYADLFNVAALRIDVGDLRLSPWGALPALRDVASGDADLNQPLTEIGAGVLTSTPNVLAYLDTQNDAAFNAGDLAYLNTDAGAFPQFVQPYDVRLLPVLGAYPQGSVVGPMDLDLAPTLGTAGLAGGPCLLDDDADGLYDPGELLYADLDDATCSDTVATNDVRLLASEAGPGGSKVTRSDGDHAAPLAPLPFTDLRFFDADGNGAFGLGDTLYLDIANNAALTADVGDLRLTPYGTQPAFTVLGSTAPDLNLPLAELPAAQGGARDLGDPGALAYFDADGTGLWSAADVLYANLDLVPLPGQLVAVGDVRLTAFTGLSLQPVPLEDLDDVETDPVPEPLHAQLDALLAQNARLGQQINASLAQGGALGEQVSALSGQLGEQTQRLSGVNGQLSALRSDNDALRTKLAQTKGAPGFEAAAALAALGAAVLALAVRRRP